MDCQIRGNRQAGRMVGRYYGIRVIFWAIGFLGPISDICPDNYVSIPNQVAAANSGLRLSSSIVPCSENTITLCEKHISDCSRYFRKGALMGAVKR